jgi:hypothetical protein
MPWKMHNGVNVPMPSSKTTRKTHGIRPRDVLIGFLAFPALCFLALWLLGVKEEMEAERRSDAERRCMFLHCTNPVARGMKTCQGHYDTPLEPFLLRPPYGNNDNQIEEHRTLREQYYAQHRGQAQEAATP